MGTPFSLARKYSRNVYKFALLVENAGHILTHQQILEKVWGWEYVDDPDYVRIYISHLRQKIEPDPALPRYIITELGVGYHFQKANGYRTIAVEEEENPST